MKRARRHTVAVVLGSIGWRMDGAAAAALHSSKHGVTRTAHASWAGALDFAVLENLGVPNHVGGSSLMGAEEESRGVVCLVCGLCASTCLWSFALQATDRQTVHRDRCRPTMCRSCDC